MEPISSFQPGPQFSSVSGNSILPLLGPKTSESALTLAFHPICDQSISNTCWLSLSMYPESQYFLVCPRLPPSPSLSCLSLRLLEWRLHVPFRASSTLILFLPAAEPDVTTAARVVLSNARQVTVCSEPLSDFPPQSKSWSLCGGSSTCTPPLPAPIHPTSLSPSGSLCSSHTGRLLFLTVPSSWDITPSPLSAAFGSLMPISCAQIAPFRISDHPVLNVILHSTF